MELSILLRKWSGEVYYLKYGPYPVLGNTSLTSCTCLPLSEPCIQLPPLASYSSWLFVIYSQSLPSRPASLQKLSFASEWFHRFQDQTNESFLLAFRSGLDAYWLSSAQNTSSSSSGTLQPNILLIFFSLWLGIEERIKTISLPVALGIFSIYCKSNRAPVLASYFYSSSFYWMR